MATNNTNNTNYTVLVYVGARIVGVHHLINATTPAKACSVVRTRFNVPPNRVLRAKKEKQL